ncbi:MAG: tRNA (adenosine(37)-N6)-threonylcarbamoyltransferase complex transferase subunit TsaD [Anaerovoracaceae bacterium]
MKNGKFITMAIETSCDETSVAFLEEGRTILSNVISSQIEIHQAYGGVVPEIASRHHLTNMGHVINRAIEEAGISLKEVDLFGVTYGPGLIGALLIGVATAKALAFSVGKPLVGVHHIQGHISSNYIENKELEPPFLAMVVSGGHTHIIDVKGYNEFVVLGQTRDDAAGEAFDKVARVLGLGYPGGPLIDRAARQGNPDAIKFKRVYLDKDSLDFSFSGTKTEVLNYINNQKQKGQQIIIEDVAAGFQDAVTDVITDKAIKAALKTGRKSIALAGGVAANSLLRMKMEKACGDNGIAFFSPSNILCTDNAAMIGCAAYYKYKEGFEDNIYLEAYATLSLEI